MEPEFLIRVSKRNLHSSSEISKEIWGIASVYWARMRENKGTGNILPLGRYTLHFWNSVNNSMTKMGWLCPLFILESESDCDLMLIWQPLMLSFPSNRLASKQICILTLPYYSCMESCQWRMLLDFLQMCLTLWKVVSDFYSFFNNKI